jgi:hypothetical protein
MVSTIRAEAGEGGTAPPDLVCYHAATTASGLPPGTEVGEEAWRLGSHCLFFITQNSGHAVKNLLLGGHMATSTMDLSSYWPFLQN